MSLQFHFGCERVSAVPWVVLSVTSLASGPGTQPTSDYWLNVQTNQFERFERSRDFSVSETVASQNCVKPGKINGLRNEAFGSSQGCLIRATGWYSIQRQTPTSRSIEGKSVPDYFKRLTPLGLTGMAVCLWGFFMDESPDGLHRMQYAIHLLEEVLCWPAKGNAEMVADCILALSKGKKLSIKQAHDYLERAIRLAREQGVKVDRHWMQGGEYTNMRPVRLMENEKPKRGCKECNFTGFRFVTSGKTVGGKEVTEKNRAAIRCECRAKSA